MEIVGDEQSLLRAFQRSSRGAKQFEHDISRASRGALAASVSFKGLGRSMAFASTQFLGGAGIIFAFKQVISEASRVQEETEKTGVVFGQNAKQVQAWSKTLAESFGVSEGAALQATGQFGNMLRPLGFGTAAAAKMSERLVELAADMASFNNAKPAEVLQALSSGLAGQVRPLRQYGVFLSQARIQQEAYADGIAKQGAKLSQAQKVQATYNIILKDTKNAQGDVARNTESLSVAMSKLQAGTQDLEAGLGRALLPTLTKYVNQAAAWLNNTQNQERVQRDVTKAVHDFTAVLQTASHVAKTVSDAVGGFKGTIEILIGLKIASWARGIAGDFQKIGGKATTAEGEVGRLSGALTGLNALSVAPIVIPIEIQLQKDVKKKIKDTAGGVAASVYDAVTGFLTGGVAGKDPVSSAVEAILGGDSKSVPTHPDHRLRRGKVGHSTFPDLTGGVGGDSGALDQLSKIQLAVSNARTAVARGEKGAQAELVAALKAQIDFDRRYENIQEGLIKNRVGDVKAHAKTLEKLQSDEQNALNEISGLSKKSLSGLTKADKRLVAEFKVRAKQAGLGGNRKAEISVLQQEEAALKERMTVEGRTLALRQQVVAVEGKIQTLQKQEHDAEQRRIQQLKQQIATATQAAFSAIGQIGQGPVATGPLAQFLQQYGGHLGAATYTADIAQQNKQFAAELGNVRRLRRRGAPKQLLDTLLGQGDQGRQEIAALAAASPGQLRAFIAQYERRQRLVTEAAKMEVHTPYVTIAADKVVVGRSDARDRPTADKFGRTGNSSRRK